MAAPLVVVTGGSGYVAGHVCRVLASSGGYRVRTTVRSRSPEKTGHLEAWGVEVVDGCDLLEEGGPGFARAFQGATYVHHCASPFFSRAPGGDPYEGFVRPAVDGTKNVLAAARAAGSVKRVVLTSSCAAVTWGDASAHPEGADHVWTEDDWQTDNTLEKGAYRLSKRLAEQAAWDFVGGESPPFELVTVCPSFVLGPVLSSRADAESVMFQKRALDGTMEKVPPLGFGGVDVRDVANAHVAAMTADIDAPGLKNAHGQARFILSSTEALGVGYLSALASHPDFAKFRVPTSPAGPAPSFPCRYDNSRAEKYLGVKLRSLDTTLLDGARSLLEHGIVESTASNKL